MHPHTVLFIFGTRPEAIKLAPLIRHLRRFPDRYCVKICVTGQHREMLDQVLSAFEITPDFDLDLMTQGQSLSQSASRIIAALEPVFTTVHPHLAIVQGDTTTTFGGALAAFYQRIPVAHVEAGLRTGDFDHPFPEELNRLLASRLAALHFAPTQRAAENLAREGITRGVSITGNTGIDAVLYIRERLASGQVKASREIADPLGPSAQDQQRIVLVTAHRRESFGDGFDRICRALVTLAQRDDIRIIYPVHPNPNVRRSVDAALRGQPNIELTEPVEYVSFVALMVKSYLILTDSGGIQEEAPSLGKPVVVMREKTERPEAVEAGTVKLAGTDIDAIVRETSRLLDDPAEYQRMSRIHNPYGDGNASQLIESAIADFLK